MGGGSARAGLEPRFVRGLRVTDEPTRDVAIAVLGGLANKTLVAALIARAVPAVGLSGIDGGMLRAGREDAELGLVGTVTTVDSSLLEDLLESGRVPVVAPAATRPAGAGRGRAGRLPPRLDRERSLALVADGTIEGGMIPKVEACLLAVAAGSDAAILAARERDAVERVLA